MALGLLIGAWILVVALVVMYERCLRLSGATQKRSSLSEATAYEQPGFIPSFTEDGVGSDSKAPDPEQFKAMFLNEDEEDIKHMLETGKITKEQVPDVLDALGISNEIQFS